MEQRGSLKKFADSFGRRKGGENNRIRLKLMPGCNLNNWVWQRNSKRHLGVLWLIHGKSS